jgi:prepilin-type N-terminal cleavage/methylation domain-containing protein
MTLSQNETRREIRRGLTLVELLVVVGLVSVLAAIVLPSIKTVLTDRKSSQAAIVVKNFFEAARSRAIGKNRSVAVVLERLSSRAQWEPVSGRYVSETASSSILSPDTNFAPYNACIRLSLAEEPLPITEKMMPVDETAIPPQRISITARGPRDGRSPNFPFSNYVELDELAHPHQLDPNSKIPTETRIFVVEHTNLSIDMYKLLGEYLVSGNEISLGNSKRRFTIVSPRSPLPHQQHVQGGNRNLWFAVKNERTIEGRGERAMEPYEDISIGGVVHSFKIYTPPKPIFSEMVQLPRGMCIDLSVSGFAKDAPRNIPATPSKQTVIDPVADPDNLIKPLSDYRFRFASDWIGNAIAPLRPEQLRPVFFVFSPEGTLSHVWANDRRKVGDNLYAGHSVRIDAVNDIFLHIGKIDRVTMPIDPDPQVLARNRTGFNLANASGQLQNLNDLNSYIVRLSPKSGAISAAPAVGLDTQIAILGLNPATLTYGDLVELSRRGTYNSNVTAQ